MVDHREDTNTKELKLEKMAAVLIALKQYVLLIIENVQKQKLFVSLTE